MHLIYGNAYLVIAASCAASPAASLFGMRKPTPKFNYRYSNREVELSVYPSDRHDFWTSKAPQTDRADSSPLHTRGWAFQERLLATRIVHFYETELVWECNTQVLCECSALHGVTESDSFKDGSSLKSEVARLSRPQSMAVEKQYLWEYLCRRYAQTKLTRQSDRLSALSGMAAKFNPEGTDKYLAGIWESHLPRALAWSAKGAVKLPEYRAPTWSWTSLKCDGLRKWYPSADAIEIIETHCTSASPSIYGPVIDGYLILRGLLIPASYGPVWKLDVWGVEYYHEELWALKLGDLETTAGDGAEALLLKKSTRVSGAWERVGITDYGCSIPLSSFEGVERSIIKLV